MYVTQGSNQSWNIPVTSEIDMLAVNFPDTQLYEGSARTGWTDVKKVELNETATLIFNFYLSVAACKTVWAHFDCFCSVQQTVTLRGGVKLNKLISCTVHKEN